MPGIYDWKEMEYLNYMKSTEAVHLFCQAASSAENLWRRDAVHCQRWQWYPLRRSRPGHPTLCSVPPLAAGQGSPTHAADKSATHTHLWLVLRRWQEGGWWKVCVRGKADVKQKEWKWSGRFEKGGYTEGRLPYPQVWHSQVWPINWKNNNPESYLKRAHIWNWQTSHNTLKMIYAMRQWGQGGDGEGGKASKQNKVWGAPIQLCLFYIFIACFSLFYFVLFCFAWVECQHGAVVLAGSVFSR